MPDLPPHVLIVDDTPAMRRLVRAEFEGMNVTVSEAADGIEALKSVHARRPDLITLDVEMPKLDGHGVCRALAKNEQALGIPIIMVSALESDAARLQAFESGAVDYFIKPFSPGTLRQLAESLFSAQAENRKRSIYSIDQDVDTVLRLQDMLTKHGYRHQGFTCVEALSDALTDDRCDLLLLDFQLPNQGSQRVIEQLRRLDVERRTRIIASTQANGRRQLAHAFHIGATDFIVKPFFVEELLARVDRQFRLQKEEGELRKLATIDPLTRLVNRGELTRRASAEVTRAIRQREALGVAMIDVDHFKAVNDTFGHAGGDQVLRAIAETLEQSVRATDLVGRFGGEELVVVLPRSTSQGLALVLERLRRRIEKLRVPTDNGEAQVTVSIGAELWGWDRLQSGLELIELLAGADEALYAAKRAGRNRIILAPLGEQDGPVGSIATQGDTGHVAV